MTTAIRTQKAKEMDKAIADLTQLLREAHENYNAFARTYGDVLSSYQNAIILSTEENMDDVLDKKVQPLIDLATSLAALCSSTSGAKVRGQPSALASGG